MNSKREGRGIGHRSGSKIQQQITDIIKYTVNKHFSIHSQHAHAQKRCNSSLSNSNRMDAHLQTVGVFKNYTNSQWEHSLSTHHLQSFQLSLPHHVHSRLKSIHSVCDRHSYCIHSFAAISSSSIPPRVCSYLKMTRNNATRSSLA